MSSLEAMSKQVRQLAIKVDGADTISESELGETLRQEARASIAFKLALFQDETLTTDGAVARARSYTESVEARKSPARKEQERRFYRQFPPTGARERLLERLAHLRSLSEKRDEEYEHGQREQTAARN